MNIAEIFAERISSGLRRKSVTSPSRWSEAYRIMGGSFPGKWNFKYYPWLREMMDSTAARNVGMKGAQVGYTELALNLVFYKMDVAQVDCLYVLPSKSPDAADFSASRFDAAVELSPHLQKLFSDVKNVGHKRAGSTNLYVRGSQSKGGLRSIPVGFLILDEVAVMNQGNIPLARERLSGQINTQEWMISTPTLPEENIDKEYNLSTQEHFFFKCPGCSRLTELTYPESIEIIGENPQDQRIHESYLKCKECGKKLESGKDGEGKSEWLAPSGIWVPGYTDRDIRGFHVNQLYSPTRHPSVIAEGKLRSFINPADEQEFFNSKLGITHTVDGARVSDEDLNNCKKNHSIKDLIPNAGPITMGVDVGKWLHYEINQWFFPKNWSYNHPEYAICKVLDLGKVRDFDDLDTLMRKWRPTSTVIDANPEKRMALSFANRFYGLVKMCYYGKGISGKTISEGKDPSEPTILVDRTAWLDLSLGRFHNHSIQLPIDVTLEYREHIKAPVRVYGKDKDGNPTGEYQSGTKPDHHAHARNYAELALPFALAKGQNFNISKVL